MADAEGLWPGVMAFANDASFCCCDCARKRYGEKAVNAVIWSTPGYEKYTDHEGNPLSPVLAESEDLEYENCNDCGEALFDEEAAEWEESLKPVAFKHTLTFTNENDAEKARKELFAKQYIKDYDFFSPDEEFKNWELVLKTVYELNNEQQQEVLKYVRGEVKLNEEIGEEE